MQSCRLAQLLGWPCVRCAQRHTHIHTQHDSYALYTGKTWGGLRKSTTRAFSSYMPLTYCIPVLRIKRNSHANIPETSLGSSLLSCPSRWKYLPSVCHGDQSRTVCCSRQLCLSASSACWPSTSGPRNTCKEIEMKMSCQYQACQERHWCRLDWIINRKYERRNRHGRPPWHCIKHLQFLVAMSFRSSCGRKYSNPSSYCWPTSITLWVLEVFLVILCHTACNHRQVERNMDSNFLLPHTLGECTEARWMLPFGMPGTWSDWHFSSALEKVFCLLAIGCNW